MLYIKIKAIPGIKKLTAHLKFQFHAKEIFFFPTKVKKNDLTLSSLFCQLSSRFTMSSIQWESVARIPAVVALKVIASPLKSMPLIPLGVTWGNTKNKHESFTDSCLSLKQAFYMYALYYNCLKKTDRLES